MKSNLLATALALGLLTQCHHRDPDPAKPEDQLPPATQTGAGTFGCLVNGKPWTPSGNNGTPNSVALYDPAINPQNAAQLNINAYRLGGPNTYMTLYCYGISSQNRTFSIGLLQNKLSSINATACYEGGSASFCDLSLNYLKGEIKLTSFDEVAGIVAGTFWFTAVRQGSPDTLKVTQGRFDYSI